MFILCSLYVCYVFAMHVFSIWHGFMMCLQCVLLCASYAFAICLLRVYITWRVCYVALMRRLFACHLFVLYMCDVFAMCVTMCVAMCLLCVCYVFAMCLLCVCYVFAMC